jgi:hypothetical protein
MLAALRGRFGAPPLASIATGPRRVVIIVDDLTRPTPADAVLPLLLDDLEGAGDRSGERDDPCRDGHPRPASADGMPRKVGPSVGGCRLVSHDDLADCPKGTPVFANRELLAADLVIGVGGAYPQHSTGFGGGVKLAIGVLGRASITRLHLGHESMNGRYDVENDFRADLAEIAGMIGLRWMVMVHVNARRQIVRLAAGDPAHTYPAAAAFSRERFAAPPPDDADVVIANAYPMDISATFMRSKGVLPLLHAPLGASRLLLAACPEGLGHHGPFPSRHRPGPTACGDVRRSSGPAAGARSCDSPCRLRGGHSAPGRWPRSARSPFRSSCFRQSTRRRRCRAFCRACRSWGLGPMSSTPSGRSSWAGTRSGSSSIPVHPSRCSRRREGPPAGRPPAASGPPVCNRPPASRGSLTAGSERLRQSRGTVHGMTLDADTRCRPVAPSARPPAPGRRG